MGGLQLWGPRRRSKKRIRNWRHLIRLNCNVHRVPSGSRWGSHSSINRALPLSPSYVSYPFPPGPLPRQGESLGAKQRQPYLQQTYERLARKWVFFLIIMIPVVITFHCITNPIKYLRKSSSKSSRSNAFSFNLANRPQESAPHVFLNRRRWYLEGCRPNLRGDFERGERNRDESRCLSWIAAWLLRYVSNCRFREDAWSEVWSRFRVVTGAVKEVTRSLARLASQFISKQTRYFKWSCMLYEVGTVSEIE